MNLQNLSHLVHTIPKSIHRIRTIKESQGDKQKHGDEGRQHRDEPSRTLKQDTAPIHPEHKNP